MRWDREEGLHYLAINLMRTNIVIKDFLGINEFKDYAVAIIDRIRPKVFEFTL